jgi:hypothetical protein
MKAGLRRSRGVFLDFGSHRDDKKKWGGQRSALSFLSIFTKACTTGIIKGVSIFIFFYFFPGSLVGSTFLHGLGSSLESSIISERVRSR